MFFSHRGNIEKDGTIKMSKYEKILREVSSKYAPFKAEDLREPVNASIKDRLGERVYAALIEHHEQQLASKITGMILDISPIEIVALIEDAAEFESVVNECVDVLSRHGLAQ